MIEYDLHSNGWTVFVKTNLKEASQEDVNAIAKLVSNHVCVVIQNQFLSIEEELRLLRMFKNLKPLFDKDDEFFEDYAADIVKDPNGEICRVTQELRNNKEGMAGWPEGFDWHTDSPETETRSSILYLRAVKGSEGSRTSWSNSVLAYPDLTDEIKETIKNLHGVYGNINAPNAPNYMGVKVNFNWTPNVVHRTLSNQVGMYISPQLIKFVELADEVSDNIKKILLEHVCNDKYVYHHDWKDGDVVLSDQWNSLHKRWAFEQMDSRLLHRADVDYPDQDYAV